MLSQESNLSKKVEEKQLLVFMINQSSLSKPNIVKNLNSKYYKSFLTKDNKNQDGAAGSRNIQGLSSGYYDRTSMRRSQANQSFSSTQDTNFRKSKFQSKLDNIVGSAFSANKRDRSTSQKIKERANKLHQSLSPISRFPLMNNLAEKMLQHIGGGEKNINMPMMINN